MTPFTASKKYPDFFLGGGCIWPIFFGQQQSYQYFNVVKNYFTDRELGLNPRSSELKARALTRLSCPLLESKSYYIFFSFLVTTSQFIIWTKSDFFWWCKKCWKMVSYSRWTLYTCFIQNGLHQFGWDWFAFLQIR